MQISFNRLNLFYSKIFFKLKSIKIYHLKGGGDTGSQFCVDSPGRDSGNDFDSFSFPFIEVGSGTTKCYVIILPVAKKN